MFSLLAVLAFSACSKVELHPAANNNITTPPAMSADERLVEIDRLLSAPLTGSQADADQRVTLRAERDVLTGKARLQASRNSAPVITSKATHQPQQIVVARDSRAENSNLSFLEQMTPGERERYFKSRRIENPQTIYYAPTRRR